MTLLVFRKLFLNYDYRILSNLVTKRSAVAISNKVKCNVTINDSGHFKAGDWPHYTLNTLEGSNILNTFLLFWPNKVLNSNIDIFNVIKKYS